MYSHSKNILTAFGSVSGTQTTCHKNSHEVSFNNEFVIGPLKMGITKLS